MENKLKHLLLYCSINLFNQDLRGLRDLGGLLSKMTYETM